MGRAIGVEGWVSVHGVVTLRDGEAHYAADDVAFYMIVSQGGNTALIWASYRGHLEVVKVLLAAGADKEAKGVVGGNGVRGGREINW